MNSVKVVDARGLSCPQPALLTRQALQQADRGSLAVLVDSGTARENVARLAEKAGWALHAEELPDGSCRLLLNR